MKRILPAYPLFIKDPFFSIYSASDKLTDSDTIFWNGDKKTTYGTIKADDKLYSFLGVVDNSQVLECVDVSITAFSTNYSFECEDFRVEMSFVSPLPPTDMTMLACPVCYLSYNISPKNNQIKQISVELSILKDWCYDKRSELQIGDNMHHGVIKNKNYHASYLGTARQEVLSAVGDGFSADWGHFYLVGESASSSNQKISATNTHINENNQDIIGKVLVAFDDTLSINYFGDCLKGYYFSDNNKTIFDAIDDTIKSFDKISQLDIEYTNDLSQKALKYGDGFSTVLFASLRQSVAAHKLVKDKKGNPLFLSKECHSNGCIATVDVSYPSIPLYLMYNPKLVKGMMIPILDFANMPVWEYDFAPHDCGCYPHCTGQVYGMNDDKIIGGNVFSHGGVRQGVFYPLYLYPQGHNVYKEEDQMPVEECSNMLIMAALYHRCSGNKDKQFILDNYKLYSKWVKYLIKYGRIPTNQLCTDDFAGKIAKNINLSIKASCGIASFALLSQAINKKTEYDKYMKLATQHAEYIVDRFKNQSYTPLAFDLEGDTYSLKYNLAPDVLLGTGLYPQEFLDKEIECYLARNNKYGVPLDTRKDYTKSDWIAWASILTQDNNKAKQLLQPLNDFLVDTEQRVPFSDWFDTVTAKQQGFQNRTVQGGIFMPLLNDIIHTTKK